jgi:GTP-binding protein
MAEEYLSGRRELALAIQLVDARHKPGALDRQLYDWMKHYRKQHLIVATKADKLSSNQLRKSLASISAELPDTSLIAYSSTTGKGRDQVWKAIGDAIEYFTK